MTASDIILETRGLTKEFRGFVAVKDVDLRVTRGHIHALIGPNGAGKTTVINQLTGVLKPNGGRLDFWAYPSSGLWWSLIAGTAGAIGAFGVLITARSDALDRIPPGQRREILRELDHVETAYGPANLGAVFDAAHA